MLNLRYKSYYKHQLGAKHDDEAEYKSDLMDVSSQKLRRGPSHRAAAQIYRYAHGDDERERDF